MIRDCQVDDAKQIADIYNHYALYSIATFDEEATSPEQMSDTISEVTTDFPWIVYEEAGALAGYAYASSWKSRCSYRFAVESSVYISPTATGQGIGSQLYAELIERLSKLKVHCAIGGISLPNDASIALHEKMGFEKVAHFKEVGYKFDRWIDVGYWELIFP